MTDPMTPLTAEAFDWNKVGPELEALGQAIADTIDPSNPMQSNESTMDCLEHLWSLGYRVVPHAAARRAIEGSGVVEALESIRDYQPTEVTYDDFAYARMVKSYQRAARQALAALPRPEEPRVERCAFVRDGMRCNDTPIHHRAVCGLLHSYTLFCHPYTPEAR